MLERTLNLTFNISYSVITDFVQLKSNTYAKIAHYPHCISYWFHKYGGKKKRVEKYFML